MAKIITIATREASIKRRLRRHLAKLGFHKNADGLLEITGSVSTATLCDGAGRLSGRARGWTPREFHQRS